MGGEIRIRLRISIVLFTVTEDYKPNTLKVMKQLLSLPCVR